MLSDYENPAILAMDAQQPLVPVADAPQQQRATRRIMIHESSSSDEEVVEEVKDDNNGNDQQSIRDRVANGEVPLDVLERQRGHAPPGAYVLTD